MNLVITPSRKALLLEALKLLSVHYRRTNAKEEVEKLSEIIRNTEPDAESAAAQA